MELQSLDRYSCERRECGKLFYVLVDEDPRHCPYCATENIEFDREEEVVFEN